MINEKIIKDIASLAKLKISENEIKDYCNEMTSILDSFNQIAQIDTNGVDPLITPVEVECIMREDKEEKLFQANDMVKNAPERKGNLFKVPPVV